MTIRKDSPATGGQSASIHWISVIYLLVLHVLAVYTIFHYFSVTGEIICLLLYVVSQLGITVAYHRYFSHGAFVAPAWLQHVLLFMGSMAAQGTPKVWLYHHKIHHRYSDTDDDLHSPRRGVFWAHVGWTLVGDYQYVDKETSEFFDRKYPHRNLLWKIMMHKDFNLLLQALVFVGLYWFWGLEVALWGVAVRLVLSYHATFLINSAAHIYGYRSSDTEDQSRNNWLVSLLTLGDGWHNNHHAVPGSARQGWKPWELDPAWWLIRSMERLGWVSEVKRSAGPGQKEDQGLFRDSI